MLVNPKLLIACLLISYTGTLSADDISKRFAASCRRDLRAVIADAAALHPQGLHENRKQREQVRRRQAALHVWQNRKAADPAAGHDNRAAAFKLLGHRKFLLLRLKQRQDYLRSVDAYLNQFEACLATSLRFAEFDQDWQDYSRNRLRQPLHFKVRQLPGRRPRQRPALYLPETTTIYFDLDALGRDPRQLIDAFEHEFWHHLLPPRPDQAAIVPWSEGYTECLAHIWRQRLSALSDTGPQQIQVDYPVASAWAALFLGRDLQGTLNVLAGLQSRKLFAAVLARRDAVSAALAATFRDPTRLPPADAGRVEHLLRNWGWRDDDGKPFLLKPYLHQDHLRHAALRRDWKQRKEFFNDLIRAKTIVHLQDLLASFDRQQIHAGLDLPKSLARNLQEVLIYASEPKREFRYWQSIQEND